MSLTHTSPFTQIPTGLWFPLPAQTLLTSGKREIKSPTLKSKWQLKPNGLFIQRTLGFYSGYLCTLLAYMLDMQ